MAFTEEGTGLLREIAPYVSWSGAHSRIREPGYFRVTAPQEWTELWQRHAGQDAAVPQVRFETCMVVAVFLGQTFDNHGVVAVSIREGTEQLTFRFGDEPYSTGLSPGSDKAPEPATPYGLFVIPRSSKPLVLEQDVRHRKSRGVSVWKERARFDKL